jgi:hypothetical protein
MKPPYYVVTTVHKYHGNGYAKDNEYYTEHLKEAKKFKDRKKAVEFMKKNPNWEKSKEKVKRISK